MNKKIENNKSIVIQNPNYNLPIEMMSHFNARKDIFFSDILEKSKKSFHVPRNTNEINFAKRLLEGYNTLSGIKKNEISNNRLEKKQKVQAFFDKIRHEEYGVSSHILDHHSPAPDGINDMWWAQTLISTTHSQAMIAEFADNVIIIGGQLNCDQGDLYKANITVNAQFGLGIERMSLDNNLYLSLPTANLNGYVDAATRGDTCDFGDQWAKCWLNTYQYVYEGLEFGNQTILVPVGSNFDTREIVFIEERYSVDTGSLPNLFSLPAVQFPRLIGCKSIFIELIFSFDFQLEGDSTVRIGVNNNPARLNTSQWKLIPS